MPESFYKRPSNISESLVVAAALSAIARMKRTNLQSKTRPGSASRCRARAFRVRRGSAKLALSLTREVALLPARQEQVKYLRAFLMGRGNGDIVISNSADLLRRKFVSAKQRACACGIKIVHA